MGRGREPARGKRSGGDRKRDKFRTVPGSCCASTQRAILRLSVVGAPGAHHSQIKGETFEKMRYRPNFWWNFYASAKTVPNPFALFANILAGLLRG